MMLLQTKMKNVQPH